MHSRVITITASSLVLGMTTSACTLSSQGRQPVEFQATRNDRPASLNDKAQKAVREGDVGAAVAALEEAVALEPQDAGYRMSLAEVYMRSGRFASAETTFADVLALNPTNSRAGFYLTLTQIAQGKAEAALAQLDSMDPELAPADVGLAYAIAGNSQRALVLLEKAARSPNASARIRQNLALAYALAGDWKRARTTAAQDIAPSEVSGRMAQWAALANPSASATRVASLLGVTTLAEDPGQPVRLALAPAVPATVATAEPVAPPAVSYAEVEPTPAPGPVADVPATPAEADYVRASQTLVQAPAPVSATAASIVPVSIPAYVSPDKARAAVADSARNVDLGGYGSQLGTNPAPAPVTAPAAFAAAPVAVSAPAPTAASVAAHVSAPVSAASAYAVIELTPAPAPVVADIPAVPVEAEYVRASQAVIQAPAPVLASATAASIVPVPIPAYVSPHKVRAAVAARSRTAGLGRYVVQLGAYRDQAQVERAWAEAQRRYRFGPELEPRSTVVRLAGKGVFHRLSVATFHAQTAATRLCQTIKARGGACFVRMIAGDARVQWASRYARRG